MSKIELINGSCADQEVDAVVNAANRFLMPGSGICGVIYAKCGYQELNEACSKINTPIHDGDAVITPAFKMKNAKYIIHAAGPNFSITPDAMDKLYLAYYNSLELLKENNLHSIAFPGISTGVYGYPKKDAAKIALKTVKEWLEKNSGYEMEITIVNFSEEDYLIYQTVAAEMG